ncbi:glycosyltransferase family 4 protein [Chryseobacterium populi]|uniref:Glycosyltransferase n=1 Tax=Chryseobacterium populi TaxID=1144316 RepID=J3CMW5_9FLAO|nr:glycosyltransferase family 4 protein [Chryseobacterium populi]EJL74909.1 glycosyltransferase [Chryseobacterium populi]
MKKILYLTFYFEPDLCAGSFRNSPLIKELAEQASGIAEIDVITSVPNRYKTYETEALKYEKRGNLNIHRIPLPSHNNGMKDQIFSYKEYYTKAIKLTKDKKYDLVISSSSRLFTAYLGYKIASKNKVPLYLDVRDIFYDTMEDVLKNKMLKTFLLPVIKQIEKRTFSYASHINLISEGFKSYFKQYNKCNYTYFTNGIDPVFINNNASLEIPKEPKKIVYAGNLGEGQGLDKIIPDAAKLLGNDYEFVIIGDGGIKNRLLEKIKSLNLKNVTFFNPMKREELIKVYEECDFTFVHLNDYEAFKKVLPSKVFELACFPQPIIAGVGGYANTFIAENIPNKILFKPCDVEDFVNQLKNFTYTRSKREKFIEEFERSTINREMASSMLKYL